MALKKKNKKGKSQFSEANSSNQNRAINNNENFPLGAFGTRSAFEYGSNNDKILPNKNTNRSLMNNLEDYSKFLLDPHIYSCIQSRKAGIMGMEWEIFSSNKDSTEVEFIENCLDNLDLNRIFNDILDAPFYGYQPLEIYWELDENNMIVPIDIIAKPPQWFKFSSSGQLKFMAKNNTHDGLSAPPRKMLLAQHQADYINPYGKSVLSRCYHHAMFKQGGMELWLMFIEKYGMPLLVGSVGSNADNNVTRKVWEILMNLKTDGVAAIPDTVTVANVNTGMNTASTDAYLKLIHYCNAELSKNILSQTLTTEAGDTGSYAMSQTHMEVRKDVVISDSKIIMAVMNQLIKWIIDLNFNNVEDKPKFVLYSDLIIDLQLAQRDKLLFEGGYCKPTRKYLTKRYGFKEDEIIMIESPAAAPEFAEGQNHNFKFDLSKFDELTRNIINQILKLVDAGESFEDIEKSIIELFPDIDTSKIEEYLAKAFVIAQANGMIDGE